jgi:fumarate reductase subunit D
MARRSHEPVFWSLFGAGGVLSALVLPVLVFITGIGVPLGLLPPETLSYDRMAAFAGHWLGKLILLAVIALPFWHAAHRIYHGLHDLGIHWGRTFFMWLCYGLAAVGSLTAMILLVRI